MIFGIFEVKNKRKECKITKKLITFRFSILREPPFHTNVHAIKRLRWLDRGFPFYPIEFILTVGMNEMKIWLPKLDVVAEEVIIL